MQKVCLDPWRSRQDICVALVCSLQLVVCLNGVQYRGWIDLRPSTDGEVSPIFLYFLCIHTAGLRAPPKQCMVFHVGVDAPIYVFDACCGHRIVLHIRASRSQLVGCERLQVMTAAE